MPAALAAVLAAAGRSLESFPAAFATALKGGKVSAAALELYLSLERNPLMRPLLGIAGGFWVYCVPNTPPPHPSCAPAAGHCRWV